MRGSIIFQPREGSGRKIIETIWRPTSTQKSKLGDLSSARTHKKIATATHQLIVLSRCHSDANFFLFLNERAPVAHPNRKIVKWWEFQGKGEHRRMLMISTFVTTQRRVAAVDRPQSTQGSFIGVFVRPHTDPPDNSPTAHCGLPLCLSAKQQTAKQWTHLGCVSSVCCVISCSEATAIKSNRPSL